jgi:hypothetical protein
VRDEIGERLVHQPEGQRVDVLVLAKLDEEALAQVSRANARRIQLLDDADHLLGFRQGVVGR